ncbi:DNA-binding MurR/RpiR family transcriptional regulator [Clostridium saccharoperbutylacetonicum]|uniref:Transcriptional regulator, RpiR family n=1 Tax=Clostridium saccharoperbutylacetonicum N1-4(HMT) TaxID=931276 RepID=M1M0L1_9CLOT|nr:MurR/RpiR family transcriptional regulator [Clostridium saccharoperbutylacetonicum]AGF59115.1 transcriptional regulator, RpiR family [Clostridium saccharoperbutylacetonicum N1-4(HMT)]NRT60097.1 DNA-binding MurR/RpiR family transcriptional regulator [Clostridium saccharoperbutylacetonicum]NSB23409.1 DNA-binding MurR/RpiR family transcriptional regulator [Clostridium saccharoperbutylacetonicum]NSB42779.1 DNA-binding MurR/RpiR family transcriptional regulator [Clostridium saccharoperbutylaceton
MFNYEIIQSLNDLELMLYRYIMKNADKVVYMRIRELADEAHVSTTTILRFCKKVDCEGYSEFKIKLKMHIQKNESNKINDDTSIIIDFFKKLDNSELEKKLNTLCDLIKAANNVIFIGTGTSGILCKYAARYFSSIGRFAMYIDDPYFPRNYKMYEDSIIIAISVSGETATVIDHISNLKRENSTIVSITNSENCTIAKISDLNISYYVQRERIGISDITTQIPVLYIIESIGKRLHNKVIDSHM